MTPIGYRLLLIQMGAAMNFETGEIAWASESKCSSSAFGADITLQRSTGLVLFWLADCGYWYDSKGNMIRQTKETVGGYARVGVLSSKNAYYNIRAIYDNDLTARLPTNQTSDATLILFANPTS